MIGWVLILSLSNSQGSSITNIPGFGSSKACVDAGTIWLNHVRNAGFGTGMATCVQIK